MSQGTALFFITHKPRHTLMQTVSYNSHPLTFIQRTSKYHRTATQLPKVSHASKKRLTHFLAPTIQHLNAQYPLLTSGMMGAVGGRELPLTVRKAKLDLLPTALAVPQLQIALPSLPSLGSPPSFSENLGPWAWQVVEEEAWEPELLGSFLIHLVLSLNPEA